ncbi:hypothetical protein MSAN_02091800 [Mycena sanguinolenta]|uniref:Uncharacterized protein n=1 Tax=Mycena sanguinolenta TaxID=230812 RepID=A0A8H6XHC4_9AGAR|nr:hypothetical protein MSAN_02091800 [Mycena sanguinolenta]
MTSSHFLPRETIPTRYDVIAGWDLGICLSLFLQGVIWAQFTNYASLCKRDSRWMKFFVAGLALLTALKGLQCLCIMWVQNVVLFGNLEAASQMWHKHWISKVSVPFEAIVAFYAQIFFCRRLWLLSRNPFVAVGCIVIFVLGLASALVAFQHEDENRLGFNPFGSRSVRRLFDDWKYSILAAAAFFHFFPRADRNHPQPPGPADPPAALCSLMIFGVAIRVHMAVTANSSIPILLMLDFVAITVLPLLYIWSAMWTLNSREDISLAAENASYTIDLGTFKSFSGGARSFEDQ